MNTTWQRGVGGPLLSRTLERWLETLVGVCFFIALGRAILTAAGRFAPIMLIGAPANAASAAFIYYILGPLLLTAAVEALATLAWFYLGYRFLALVIAGPVIILAFSPLGTLHRWLGYWWLSL